MPGIVGFFSKAPRERMERELSAMVAAIRHESFYDTGTWIDEDLGVYIGWTVRRNSFSDSMPVRNESGDVVLVFSGEDFPEPGTVERLKASGHEFESDGPSYLAHIYEEDPRFPAGLNGRFQGLVANRSHGTATLFNDRYGMHRVHYYQSKEAFYFAAEAKAILAVRPESRRMNPRAFGELVGCGCVMEGRTLFDGIRVLPPGAAWIFRNGQLDRKGRYFEAQEWENQEPLAPEAYYQELRRVFSQNLSRYFNGRERVGMSLTGGLDTRMIMSWHKSAPGSLPCYSFGGMFRDCQDVVLARRVARLCGQSHEVIPIGPEFLSRFSHYAERAVYLTDGCAPVNRASDLYANELAREIAPTRMTGNYGSEILRRLIGFKPTTPGPGLYRKEFIDYIDQARTTYTDICRGHATSFIAFRQLPTHHYGIMALEETQLSMRSPYIDNDLVRTVFRSPESAFVKSDIFADNNDCLRLIQEGLPAIRRMRTDRGLAGASALTRGVLEFTFKAEYAYDYGMPNWLAKADHALSLFRLERLFLGRHKFNHYRFWYRDALAGYVREMLLDPRTLSRPYLDSKTVESMVQTHLRGTRNYTSEIHSVLSLELIHRLFLDPR